jgi:hypothetical protein
VAVCADGGFSLVGTHSKVAMTEACAATGRMAATAAIARSRLADTADFNSFAVSQLIAVPLINSRDSGSAARDNLATALC